MLVVREGDLFENLPDECVVAHGANAQGKMGSGFAKQLRERFPQSYTGYYSAHLETPLQVGDLIIVVCDDEQHKVHVCHCITQEYYGHNPNIVYVDYEAVAKTLKEVAIYAQLNKLPILLPFIGGGLANGDEARLREIFQTVFMDVDATLWLHTQKETPCPPSRRSRFSARKALPPTR